MEGGRTAVNEGQFESARRCLVAAERSTDKSERRALGRAGLKFLCGALGMCGVETQGATNTPTPARAGMATR
jgi:hypothetical protein